MLPLKPSGFAGGRNGNANLVDLAWVTNPECDVVGYRVYSGASAATITSPVTCLGAASATLGAKVDECIVDAPAGNVWYKLVALDTPSAGGTPREGTASDPLAIGPASGNAVPTAPTNLSSCIGGPPGCNVATGVPADDGVLVIRWDASTDSDGTIQLYRFYRDGVTYAQRHASFYPKTGELLAWIEPEPDSSSHELPDQRGRRRLRRVRAQRSPAHRVCPMTARLRQLASEEGFTLVEVLIAAVLMIVVLGATLTTLTSFQRSTADQPAPERRAGPGSAHPGPDGARPPQPRKPGRSSARRPSTATRHRT